MQLDIWSDPVCPWCYLGYARLKRAIARENPFQISWKPFQLDPSTPKSGYDRMENLLAKFGSRTQIDAAHDRITEMGKAAGITYNFDASPRVANSFDAHRLIYWATLEGCADTVAEDIFTRNFRDGQDISDPKILEDIAQKAGMKPGMVTRLLATDANTKDVAAEEARGRAMGISGVPLFVIDNQYALSGAQEETTWADVIRDVMAATA
jgi:predicted DsbA family dithiol-disulfide isomerase